MDDCRSPAFYHAPSAADSGGRAGRVLVGQAMRAIRVEYLADLSELSSRLSSIMGWDTELFVEIGKHPVWSDDELIGYFEWVDELEGVVFRPEKI